MTAHPSHQTYRCIVFHTIISNILIKYHYICMIYKHNDTQTIGKDNIELCAVRLFTTTESIKTACCDNLSHS